MKLTNKEYVIFSFAFVGFLSFFIVFRILPILYTLWRSFFTIQQGEYVFAGVNAYLYVLNQGIFWQSIFNSLTISSIYIVLKTLILITIGEWMMRNPKSQRWFLKIAYIPTITGGFVYAILFRYLLDSNGAILSLFPNINIQNSVILNQFLIAVILIWTSFGISLIMYLNRRKHINRELVEFSQLEGANQLQSFWYVILPHTKSVILLIGLLSTIEVFTEIEIPMNLTFGGPLQSTITFGYLNYLAGLVFGNFGYASASTVIFLVLLFLLVIIIKGVYEKIQKLR